MKEAARLAGRGLDTPGFAFDKKDDVIIINTFQEKGGGK